MRLDQTIRTLEHTWRRQAAKLALTRLVWVTIAGVLALVLMDFWWQLNNPARGALDAALMIVVVAVGALSYHRLTRVRSPARRVGRLVEEANPALGNELVNAIDFTETLRRAEPPRGSAALMQQEITLATTKLDQAEVTTALRPPSLAHERVALVGALVTLLVAGVSFLDAFLAIAPRYWDPWGDHPPYSPTQLRVAPAGTTVDYGESVRLVVETSGPRPQELTLVLTDDRGRERAALPMFESAPNVYFQVIEAVREEAVYYARIPGGRSRRYRLGLSKAPKIETAVVRYDYPPYTGLLPETRYLQEPVLKGYARTTATVTLTSNRPLRDGGLTVGGVTYPLARVDAQSVAGRVPLLANGEFSATVTDVEGLRSPQPLAGKVEIIPDDKPEVAVVSPGTDSFALPTARVAVNVEARDDLGVARIDLFRSHNDSEDLRKTLHPVAPASPGSPIAEGNPAPQKLVNVIETLDLADLGVQPGDVIDYYVTATDSNPDAPQTIASPAYRLLIISPDEYRQYLQAQMSAEDLTRKYEAILEALERLADLQADLARTTEQLRQGVGQTGTLTAAQQAGLEQVRAQQQALAEQAVTLARRLKAEAASPPIYDVETDYKETLGDLSRQLHAVGELMERSEYRLGKAEPANGGQPAPHLAAAREYQQQALELLGREREGFARGIDAANRDIEKISALQADVEQFKYLLQRQQTLERQARFFKDLAAPGFEETVRLKELAEEEAGIQQELSELTEDLRSHARDLADAYPRVRQDAEAIAAEIERRGIENLMRRATGQLGRGAPRQGYPPARDALAEMQAMVAICEGAAGRAGTDCELRLRITMDKALGNTLAQLAQAFRLGGKPGEGRGFGRVGAGQAGYVGRQTPFNIYGTEEFTGRPTESAAGGRHDAQARSLPGEPEPMASSIEEVVIAKDPERSTEGAGGERFLHRYQRLIEEYFRRLAEEE